MSSVKADRARGSLLPFRPHAQRGETVEFGADPRRPGSQEAVDRSQQTCPRFVNWIQILRKCDILQECSFDFLRILVDDAESSGCLGTIYDPGDKIVREGDRGKSMFVVYRGTLEAKRKGVVLGYIGAGGFFDDAIVLGTYSCFKMTVRAVTLCHLCEITCASFSQALIKCPLDRRFFEWLARERRLQFSMQSQVLLTPQQQGYCQIKAGGFSHGDFHSEAPASNAMQPAATTMSSTVGESVANAPRATTAEEAAFVNVLTDSIRRDVMRGYRIPDMVQRQAQTVSDRLKTPKNRGTLVETQGPDFSSGIDLNLLPPLKYMSPMQKQVLRKHFEAKIDRKGVGRPMRRMGSKTTRVWSEEDSRVSQEETEDTSQGSPSQHSPVAKGCLLPSLGTAKSFTGM